MNPRELPIETNKSQLLEHVLHEVEMMAVGLEVLASIGDIPEKDRQSRELPLTGLNHVSFQYLYNAAMEGVLLHARNLYEFLFPKKWHPDDLDVTDFADGISANRPGWQEFETICKEVLHLTKRRTNVTEDKKWKLLEVTKLVRDTILPFLVLRTKESEYQKNRERLEWAIAKLRDLEPSGEAHRNLTNRFAASSVITVAKYTGPCEPQ